MFIARQVLDFTDTDEVWFLPNWGQSFEKPAASPVHRLAMTRLIALDRTRVSTLEMDHQLNGQTIGLLPFLPKDNSYRFIIGADQLPSFHKWGSYRRLLERLPFLVFPRLGYINTPLYQNMTLLAHPLLMASDISSTKIRQRVNQGLPVDVFVSGPVHKYIVKHGLYL